MTVFTFQVFFDANVDEVQYRYVAAESESEAWAKLIAYFEKQRSEGFMYPARICNPEAELENVIL